MLNILENHYCMTLILFLSREDFERHKQEWGILLSFPLTGFWNPDLKMIKKKKNSLKELNGVNKCKSLFYLDSLSSAEFYKMSDSPQFRKSASYILKSPFKMRQHQ